MHSNFSLPLGWDTGEADAATDTQLPLLDARDKALVETVRAMRELGDREKNLVLLMTRTIAMWKALPQT